MSEVVAIVVLAAGLAHPFRALAGVATAGTASANKAPNMCPWPGA